jgi:hypothetical protein
MKKSHFLILLDFTLTGFMSLWPTADDTFLSQATLLVCGGHLTRMRQKSRFVASLQAEQNDSIDKNDVENVGTNYAYTSSFSLISIGNGKSSENEQFRK